MVGDLVGIWLLVCHVAVLLDRTDVRATAICAIVFYRTPSAGLTTLISDIVSMDILHAG